MSIRVLMFVCHFGENVHTTKTSAEANIVSFSKVSQESFACLCELSSLGLGLFLSQISFCAWRLHLEKGIRIKSVTVLISPLLAAILCCSTLQQG